MHGIREAWKSKPQAFELTGRRMVMDRESRKKVPELAEVNFKEVGKLEAIVAAGAANHFDFRLTSAGEARLDLLGAIPCDVAWRNA